jgi:hypothetical protein
VKANDFLNTLGAGTKDITGLDTPDEIILGLEYTGVRNIRDDATVFPGPNQYGGNQGDLCAIHEATGAMVDELPAGPIAASAGNTNDNSVAVTQIEYEFLASCGAMLQAEGLNEPNNEEPYYEGNRCLSSGSFLPCAQFQAAEYQMIKTSDPNAQCTGPGIADKGYGAALACCTGVGTGTCPSLNSYPVVNLSENGAEPDNTGLQDQIVPDTGGFTMPAGTTYFDVANAHNYAESNSHVLEDNQALWAESVNCGGGNPGEFDVSGEEWQGSGCGQGTWAKGYPIAATGQNAYPKETTETGWNIFDGSITADQQGRLLTDVYLQAVRMGWSNTFIYLLFNDKYNDGFGMLNQIPDGGTAAENATLLGQYVHNLTTILADNSSNFTVGTANPTISGMPSTGYDLLMQKSSGTYELAVWGEAFVSETPTNVTVELGASYPTVNVYDITVGTTPIQTFTNVSSVPLTLTDHAFIVEFGDNLTP